MLQDLAKVGTDFTSMANVGWHWQQWFIAAFFVWMGISFGWAWYENKYPSVRSSHLVFFIVQLVAFAVLWTSGFFK